MNTTTDLLGWLASASLLLGALLSLLGALGVWRLPDAYSRMHAASKAGALGAMFFFLGVALASGGSWGLKALLGIAILLLVAPLAAHGISRAAYRSGHRPALGPLGDQLAAASRKQVRR